VRSNGTSEHRQISAVNVRVASHPVLYRGSALEILLFFRCLLQQFVAALKPIRNSV